MGKYLFLERRLPVYDIAVAITKLDMCRSEPKIEMWQKLRIWKFNFFPWDCSRVMGFQPLKPQEIGHD